MSRRNRLFRPLVAGALVALAAFVPEAQAAPAPLVVRTVGRLLDGQDHPVAGPVKLTFSFHSSAIPNAEDQVVWTDTFDTVPLDPNGAYAVALGETTGTVSHKPLTGDVFQGVRYLSVAVNGTALTPWMAVSAVPYATNAASVNGIPAGTTAAPNALLALDANARFPVSVLPKSDGTSDGYLAAADFAKFMGKLDAVSAEAPLAGDGTAGNKLRIGAASATADGVLRAADFRAFDGKLAAVAVGAGLTGDGTAANPLAVQQIGIAATAPLSGDGTSAHPLTINLPTASASGAGVLAAADFQAFQGKLASVAVAAGGALSGNGTAGSPLQVGVGTGANQVAAGNHTHADYLSLSSPASQAGNPSIGGNLTVSAKVTAKDVALTGGTVTTMRVENAAADPLTCDAAHGGQLYFNTQKNAFFGCNTTRWVQLATGALCTATSSLQKSTLPHVGTGNCPPYGGNVTHTSDAAATSGGDYGFHDSNCPSVILPAYIAIDYGVATPAVVTKLRIQLHQNPMKGALFQASNDSTNGTNGTWTTLSGPVDMPSGLDMQWWDWPIFQNATAYRWYRLYSTTTAPFAIYRWDMQGCPG